MAGGAGFIGSHTVDRLLREGYEVVVLDNLRSGRLENLAQHADRGNFCFVRGDVRDSRLVKELVGNVDAVLSLAALVSVPESVADPVLAEDINVRGTLNLLRACVSSNVKRFVYASSCAVYGDAEKMPIAEDCPKAPMSPYGASKLAAEKEVYAFNEKFGLETVCLRYFNVYGPRQLYNQYSGVITQFLKRIKENAPLVIFGDGEQTRDFVYVEDVVEANLLALKCAMAVGGVFNIGTGVGTSVNKLADMLLDVVGKKNAAIVRCEARKGDIRHSVADISKARERLGYSPKTQLKDGLRKLLSKD